MSFPSQPRIGAVLAAAALLIACKPEKLPANRIGPEGGVISSEDDGFTMVLWPGALGEYFDFVVEPAAEAPPSFGLAYSVTPNPELGIAADIIMRGDLPDPATLANVGALDVDATSWRVVPRISGGVDVDDETVRAHDAEVAAAYAMLDMGGNTDTTGGSSDTTDSGDPTGPPLSFATDIQPIFAANCLGPAGSPAANCHSVSPQGGALILDTEAFTNIVGVAAMVNSSFVRVVPSSPDDSLLLLKVEGTPPPGTLGPMPPAGPIDEASQAMLRSWIAQGCPE